MFGNLTLADFANGPIVLGAQIFMLLVIIGIAGLLTYFRRWKWLYSEWLTSVDHKKIGVMYIIIAIVMLLRGLADALMMRAQQMLSVGDANGYLPPEHYDQIFTAHGVIMIFFMAMPFMFGLVNLVVPLQIGARDVAFPFMNNVSLWLTAVGALLVNVSLAIGEFAAVGWLAYPPLSELQYSPGVGVDYYIWALQIAGVGSLLSGINFFVTIIKLRCKGMTLMKMPIFAWTTLATMSLVIVVFPILTATLALLFLDRYFGMHFFTTDMGGDPMMYINMIWAWGHPEVYILVLPAFGIFSEIVPVFSQKRLFGYTSFVFATVIIGFLSFIVWLHHFFTMGSGANVNAFFGIATMLIAIPTGVKIFNWLFTMFRGRIIFSSPMYWFLGFVFTFTLGGMTGVLLAIPPADFQLHNSLFLVAHFHNTIIGGVVFGYLAGFVYWFPKFFGFKLNEWLGKSVFFCWIVGFVLAFVPLYVLGLMGFTRRLNHLDDMPGVEALLIVAAIGATIIAVGVVLQVVQLIASIVERKRLRDTTGDPWNARTLEWSTSSPPPHYNFAVIPHVHERDAFWDQKYGSQREIHAPEFHDIHMPKNTGVGLIIAAAAFVGGFGLVWHITWMIVVALLVTIAALVARSFATDVGYIIPADELRRHEAAHPQRFAHQNAT